MSLRNVRNNNPGNLSQVKPPWFGSMSRKQMTPQQAAEPRFAVFVDPPHGFRGLCLQLFIYQRKHGIWTISNEYKDTVLVRQGLIPRWAPPEENNTEGYEERVSNETHIGRHEIFDLGVHEHIISLARAITDVETGAPFELHWREEDLEAGAKMAEAA